MVKTQLKDFLIHHLLSNTFPMLLWWKSVEDETFCVNLADGRKKRNDSRLAALAKAWEKANGRDAVTNSKMNLKEALKHCPYVKEISRDKQSGIHIFCFAEKACLKKSRMLSTEEAQPSEMAYEPLLPGEYDVAEQIEKIISRIMQNNSNFCGNITFSIVSFEPPKMTITFSNLSPTEVVPANNCGYLSLDHGYSASSPIQQIAHDSFGPESVCVYRVATENVNTAVENQMENPEMIELEAIETDDGTYLQQVNSPNTFSEPGCDITIQDDHTNMEETLPVVESQTDQRKCEETSNFHIPYESFGLLEDPDEFTTENVNFGIFGQLPDKLEELVKEFGIGEDSMPIPYTY